MKSLIAAATGLIAGFLLGYVQAQKYIPAAPPPTPKSDVPEGYTGYKFKCWLCSGDNRFACKPQIEERKFQLDCKWCGVENSVKVKPSAQPT